MPKPGYKSFSLNEKTYNKFYAKFESEKKKLREKGVNNFTSYVVYKLTDKSKESAFLKYSRPLQKLYVKSDLIVIKDNLSNKIIEITLVGKKLFCELDKRYDCIHVGFAYSFPEILTILGEKNINTVS